ncbi:hypothetical protein [Agrobacterium larrymoorei]|uniref:Exo-alpha-sialidase n=1 Tax=Agrobacterium larrymoorei TaxID=160699 RepID=A0A4D7DX56_9HYPH|nr:hypothetical protein [Agrobacterium larrymoorei]QCI98786.1 hypothetical protein CFBP5473_13305 [Agrobacterium larrymoorei]QYA08327.1 hypothetical protein J5285_06435 [Agrobacterium larrymoorei]WHA40871.1 hypothetical protein CFBP5477_013815 [Agrobacterium larrymoorei]
MSWKKLGRVFCPEGVYEWAEHSFMTPVPLQITEDVIRIFGGVRDKAGVSRISWIDVDRVDPTKVLRVADKPALGTGQPGMFDDNGVILGDIIRQTSSELWMYYVGFQIVQEVKFLAFTGLAISHDGGSSFTRVQNTPVLDRSPKSPFIGALHSIEKLTTGYRAWISCGHGWKNIQGISYPEYNCWMIESPDGVSFDMNNAIKIMDVEGSEYRIGRPRANRNGDGYELRVTSDTVDKRYESFLAVSKNGITFERTKLVELPRGSVGDWDSEMTCYPAKIVTEQGDTYLFYNGNGMGRSGVGVAIWEESGG